MTTTGHDAYIPQSYAQSRRVKLEDTCQREEALYVRKASPDAALVQIWTKEGEKNMRYSIAHMSKSECLKLAEVLTNLASQIEG